MSVGSAIGFSRRSPSSRPAPDISPYFVSKSELKMVRKQWYSVIVDVKRKDNCALSLLDLCEGNRMSTYGREYTFMREVRAAERAGDAAKKARWTESLKAAVALADRARRREAEEVARCGAEVRALSFYY